MDPALLELVGEFLKLGGWGVMVFLLLTGNLFTKAHIADLRDQIVNLTKSLADITHSTDRLADAWEARNKAEGDK